MRESLRGPSLVDHLSLPFTSTHTMASSSTYKSSGFDFGNELRYVLLDLDFSGIECLSQPETTS
jgi:hypothetical protein